MQLLDPAYRGGANAPSLIECQANYDRAGACEERFLDNVRSPEADEARDVDWRPVQESDLRATRAPSELSAEEYGRIETWYYWKRKDA